MTPEQYDSLILDEVSPETVDASVLSDQSDRTLLYGYNVDRHTHHVYLFDGVLHVLIYDNSQNVLRHEKGEISFDLLIPNKRLYPESCDFEFCRWLQKRVYLPFTSFDGSRQYGSVFVGYVKP